MMTEHDIQVVKSTIPVLRESGVALTQYFYQRMLKANPQLKSVFNLSNQAHGRQPRALAAAVLAYAEHIEHPEMLQKAIDRIAATHVAVHIQPAHYPILGEHLLHSISEVLNLPMDHDIIQAWEKAYTQLAHLLIEHEQQIYHRLEQQSGSWTGWREFEIVDKQNQQDQTELTLAPIDHKETAYAKAGQSIMLKVKVKQMGIEQPQHYTLTQSSDSRSYSVAVTREPVESGIPSVSNILLDELQIGDHVQLTAPLN